MGMAEAAHGDAGAEVEILPALVVPDIPALAFHEGERPDRRRYDVLIIKRLDFGARGSLRGQGMTRWEVSQREELQRTSAKYRADGCGVGSMRS